MIVQSRTTGTEFRDELLAPRHYPAALRFDCTPQNLRKHSIPARRRIVDHVKTMNDYIHARGERGALKDNLELARKTYVFPDPTGGAIAAYYTIAMTAVQWSKTHPATKGGRVAALHFDDLAVDRRYAHQGLATQIYWGVLKYAATQSLAAARFLYGEAFRERLGLYVGKDTRILKPTIMVSGLRTAIEEAVLPQLGTAQACRAVEGIGDIHAWLREVRDASRLLKRLNCSFVYLPGDDDRKDALRLEGLGTPEAAAVVDEMLLSSAKNLCLTEGHFLCDVPIPFLIDLKWIRDSLEGRRVAA